MEDEEKMGKPERVGDWNSGSIWRFITVSASILRRGEGGVK